MGRNQWVCSFLLLQVAAQLPTVFSLLDEPLPPELFDLELGPSVQRHLGAAALGRFSGDVHVLTLQLANGTLRLPVVYSRAVPTPSDHAQHFHAAPPALGGVTRLKDGAIIADVFSGDRHVQVSPTVGCRQARDHAGQCHSVHLRHLPRQRGHTPISVGGLENDRGVNTSASSVDEASEGRRRGYQRYGRPRTHRFRKSTVRFHRSGVRGPSASFHGGAPPLELRVAVFVEHRAVGHYESILSLLPTSVHLHALLETYLNQIAAVYSDPSLGMPVRVTFPQVTVWRSAKPRPADEPVIGWFCREHKKLQQAATRSWDVGLYLYGGDLDHKALGVAVLGSTCGPDHQPGTPRSGCAVVEFGSHCQGRSDAVPTAGLGLSALVAAHELGHTLGLRHDGDGNSCDNGPFLMASGADSGRPALHWSACSQQAAHRFWPGCLSRGRRHSRPPLRRPALPSLDQQCQVQLSDLLATAVTDGDPCSKLMCEQATITALRELLEQGVSGLNPYSGVISPGPALEGSACGDRRVCRLGSCVPCPDCAATQKGRWTPWHRRTSCRSPCYEGAVGLETFSRRCVGADPSRPADCGPGPRVRHVRCSPTCRHQLDWREYGRSVCSRSDGGADARATRGDYSATYPVRACAVRCWRPTPDGRGRVAWWPTATGVDGNVNGDGPFYPDGSPCHTSADGVKHYCVAHHCLSEHSIGRL